MSHISVTDPWKLAEEMAELKRENAALREALEELVYFADNSQGIAGWHLNGEVFTWDQIEAIDKARAVLVRKEAQP